MSVMDLLSAPWIQDAFQSYGLYAVFCVIMLESMGVPMPGETILIIAGIYAGSTRRIELLPLIATATIAAIVGDNIGYLLGRSVGRASLQRYGKYIRLDERRIKVGQYLFMKHGGKIVFFGRFVAFLRTFAAVLAGANQMSWPHFSTMNALGGLCWACLAGGGAYFFGERVERVAAPFGILLLLGAAALIVGGALYFKRYERALEDLAERTCVGP